MEGTTQQIITGKGSGLFCVRGEAQIWLEQNPNSSTSNAMDFNNCQIEIEEEVV